MSDLCILFHEGRDRDYLWLIQERPQIIAAMWALFRLLDAQGCYDNFADQRELREARAGEHMPIYRILNSRQDVEGQRWFVKFAVDPCK